MNRICFIRHGATAGNLQRRYIGRTDEPLCEKGVFQIEELKKRGLQADRLFISPALRTRQTAQLLFPNLRPTVVEGLMETDFGIFEGKNAQELEGNPAYRAWVDSGCRAPIPGGESVPAFKARCCEAFLGVMEQLPEGIRAAFVIHGGGIMAILEAFARPHRDFYDYHLANGAFLECTYQDGVIRCGEDFPCRP